MAFALTLNIASSSLLYLSLHAETLEAQATSAGWNTFCEGIPTVELRSLIDPVEFKAFQGWLKSVDNSPFDLWLTHPKEGRVCQRCQKLHIDSNQIVIQLTPTSDLQLDRKLLRLLTELTAIAERHHEDPTRVQQGCIELLVRSLRAEGGGFGYLQNQGEVRWLGSVGKTPTSFSRGIVNRWHIL